MQFCFLCKTDKKSQGTVSLYLYCVVLEKQTRAKIVNTSLLLSNIHFIHCLSTGNCISHCVRWGMDKCDNLTLCWIITNQISCSSLIVIPFKKYSSCLVTHTQLYIASKLLELWLQLHWKSKRFKSDFFYELFSDHFKVENYCCTSVWFFVQMLIWETRGQ